MRIKSAWNASCYFTGIIFTCISLRLTLLVNLYFELQKAGGATGNAAAKKAKTADASASIDVKKEAEEGRVTVDFFVLVFL